MAAASSSGSVSVNAEHSGGSTVAEFSVTDPSAQENVVVKIGMVGDAGVGRSSSTALSCHAACYSMHRFIIRAGKTSLMVKYVEGSFDEVPQQHRSASP
jgi:hypothetical protein